MGVLVVSAKEARTGEPVERFCATILAAENLTECTGSGALTIRGLPTGRALPVVVRPDGGRNLLADFVAPVIGAEQPTAAAAVFGLGGTIAARVTDRRTGEVYADDTSMLWIRTVSADSTWAFVGLTEGDDKGFIHSEPLPAGDYRIFVAMGPGGRLGSQWVGANGGSGREHQAATVTVGEDGETVAPAVLLDPAGTVHGKVLHPDGSPVVSGIAGYESYRYNDQALLVDSIGADGAFRSRNLGPYEWAIRFMPNAETESSTPDQWVGGTIRERDATTVRVEPGVDKEQDFRLAAGTTLEGKVSGPTGDNAKRYALLVDAREGVVAGSYVTGTEPTYSYHVIGGSDIKIRAATVENDDPLGFGWHDNAASFDEATPIPVPASGKVTVDLRFPTTAR
ncbi:hypothetical protein [Pilimelia anulata]|nr:hypothetical protein [Pilimelia anulata]